jgi:hypothetical protein
VSWNPIYLQVSCKCAVQKGGALRRQCLHHPCCCLKRPPKGSSNCPTEPLWPPLVPWKWRRTENKTQKGDKFFTPVLLICSPNIVISMQQSHKTKYWSGQQQKPWNECIGRFSRIYLKPLENLKIFHYRNLQENIFPEKQTHKHGENGFFNLDMFQIPDAYCRYNGTYHGKVRRHYKKKRK